ncbi:GNAT family N-acetyltransferase [Luteolibacter sp. SL250]|uniref:GNAT family N-acetyltransferase n=1 Tax=Luteolibacter sp. SL250 TaxID=2995170 RepID=UPI002271537E|nr:GNAT family N-acetyltransferase [Luteolibacter sp. SL250]WAC21726.1 GNAT family N-acetyltransferase [Luteolibacter sp. SL250]
MTTHRPFLPSDLDACTDLFVATFAQPPWSETWGRDVALARLAQLAGTPGFYGVVAEGEKGPVGFVMGISQPWPGGNHYYLQEACVDHRFQRQGVGTALMAWLSARVEEQGNRRIYLLTARDDVAEAFYSKIGFYTSPRMILMARRFE